MQLCSNDWLEKLPGSGVQRSRGILSAGIGAQLRLDNPLKPLHNTTE